MAPRCDSTYSVISVGSRPAAPQLPGGAAGCSFQGTPLYALDRPGGVSIRVELLSSDAALCLALLGGRKAGGAH